MTESLLNYYNQVRNLRKVLEVRIESSSEFTAAEIKRVIIDDT